MRQITVAEIMDFLEREAMLNASYIGDKNILIKGFCSLNKPKSNAISWVKHTEEGSPDTFQGCDNCVFVVPQIIPSFMENVGFIVTSEPKAVFFRILEKFWKEENHAGISATSLIETENIGRNVRIGHNCYIGKDVKIGDGCSIEHNVSIYHRVVLGQNCIIHSGAVIGADGFGFFINHAGEPEKVRHFGGVIIGDDVEIGANACIDRGTIDDTCIGRHSKIDNLVHIAHNVQINESVMVVAGAVVCGSAVVGEKSYIAPGGIVKNQLQIGTNAFVGMGAVVTKSVEDGIVVAGVPAKPLRRTVLADK